jgi:septal ring factor EnvC (AmiA/AmiB activator)
MFGIKIITTRRYRHLVGIEQNFEQEKQNLLNQLDRIEKDLDSLREQLSEKMMENNKLYDQVRELVSIKPSFRKSTTKSRKKEP